MPGIHISRYCDSGDYTDTQKRQPPASLIKVTLSQSHSSYLNVWRTDS